LAHHWVDCERAFIAQRYDRIAGLIGLFDWLFFFPPHLRARAAARLDAEPGDRVLEIGCGTGRNFPHLRAAVGPTGKVYGVDLSAGMLRKARELCEREQWTNVEVTHCDALEYIPPEPLDGILFGLSYNTMPHHLAVLRHAWKQLRPGGRIVLAGLKKGRTLEGLVADKLILKEITLEGVLSSSWSAFDHAISLLGRYEGELVQLCTHVYGIDNAEKALKVLGREIVDGKEAVHVHIDCVS